MKQKQSSSDINSAFLSGTSRATRSFSPEKGTPLTFDSSSCACVYSCVRVMVFFLICRLFMISSWTCPPTRRLGPSCHSTGHAAASQRTWFVCMHDDNHHSTRQGNQLNSTDHTHSVCACVCTHTDEFTTVQYFDKSSLVSFLNDGKSIHDGLLQEFVDGRDTTTPGSNGSKGNYVPGKNSRTLLTVTCCLLVVSFVIMGRS